MNIVETIQNRKSWRSYRRESLTSDEISSIKDFIATRKPLFGTQFRIEFIEKNVGDETLKLGTYGFVRGALSYLALAYKDSAMAEESAAYAFEEVVLHCTNMGLGTCWMGGSFNSGDFATAIDLSDDETLRIVSPVGYKADSRSFLDAAMGAIIKHNNRKNFDTLFFDSTWGKPLTAEAARAYTIPLEMVRLAPSARNKQPWRVLVTPEAVHFYRDPEASSFTRTDMGIAMCHFALACAEGGVGGHFDLVDHPEGNGAEYCVSWVK